MKSIIHKKNNNYNIQSGALNQDLIALDVGSGDPTPQLVLEIDHRSEIYK